MLTIMKENALNIHSVLLALICLGSVNCKLLKYTQSNGGLKNKYCPEIIYRNLSTNASTHDAIPEQTINKTCELKFIYEIDTATVVDEGKSLSITFTTSAAEHISETNDCPILFAIFNQNQIVPVILPYNFEKDDRKLHNNSSTIYYNAGRILCTSRPNSSGDDGRNIAVHVSTCRESDIKFNISAELKDNLMLSNGSTYNLIAGPTTPQYVVYKFPKLWPGPVRVITDSTDDICMVVSIQTIYCPIYELEDNVKYPTGIYKTMTHSSVIEVKKTEDFQDGFAIVFVVKHDDTECFNPSNNVKKYNRTKHGLRNKNFTVRVLQEPDTRTRTLLGFFAPILFSMIVGFIVILCYRPHQNYMTKWTTSRNARNDENVRLLEDEDDEMIDPFSPQDHNVAVVPGVITETGQTPSQLSARENYTHTQGLSDLLYNDIEELPLPLPHTVAIRRPRSLFLSDFHVRKEPKIKVDDDTNYSSSIKIKTGMDHYRKMQPLDSFWSILLLVSFFYAVPVYELVINFLTGLNKNGNYDDCFFNELCSNSLGSILDFNHFWSNISYCLLGLLFCVIVKIKGSLSAELPTAKGIAFQGELFYALGIALMMEGVFSAAYHLCPNKFTFQYDTTFMYVVSSLVLVFLFLSRHPVIHFTASFTYGGLAVLVVLTALSYVVDICDIPYVKNTFYYVYLISQTILILIFSIYYCDVGLIKDDTALKNAIVSPIIIWRRLSCCFCNGPKSDYAKENPFIWKRAITAIIILCASVALFISLTLKGTGFATVLLFQIVTITAICKCNYIILKICNGEFSGEKKKLFVFPAISFMLCIAVGVGAVNFFFKTSYNSDDTPAESRSKNTECYFLNFYDNHDMWHLLSSASLFFGCMGLLTMDDGLAKTPHEEITVF